MHSFLDPVGDFMRDDIWKPTQPFELVPGKDPNGWSFVLEPYVWAMGLNGNVGVKGLPPSKVDFSRSLSIAKISTGESSPAAKCAKRRCGRRLLRGALRFGESQQQNL